MRPLRFVALSEDGKHLVLAPDVPEAIDNGERFMLALDDRLRAASRGDISRLGQIELELESQLRPREIQARIRAGETPDAVAAAAGIRIERVMKYAYPVLQERAQIARRAQTARVKIEDSVAHPPTLLELIESRLLVRGLEQTAIDWDARRLDSGQWEVSSTWLNDDRTVTAHWRYDLQNGIVYPGSKDTIEMVEPKRALAALPVPAEDPSLGDGAEARTIPLQRPREQQGEQARRPARPRAAYRDVELEQLFLPDELDDAADPGQTANAARRPELRDEPGDQPRARPTEPRREQPAGSREPQAPQSQAPQSQAPQPRASQPQAPQSQQRPEPADNDEPGAKDRKPRIPSWDDIVFGVKKRK